MLTAVYNPTKETFPKDIDQKRMAQKNFFSLYGFSDAGTGDNRGSSLAWASQYDIKSAAAFETCLETGEAWSPIYQPTLPPSGQAETDRNTSKHQRAAHTHVFKRSDRPLCLLPPQAPTPPTTETGPSDGFSCSPGHTQQHLQAQQAKQLGQGRACGPQPTPAPEERAEEEEKF